MVVREHTRKYTTGDLIDKINSSLLNDESKSILIKFVDKASVQYSELYHQLSRQSLAVELYKMLRDADNNFAQFVFDCLSSDNIDLDYVSRQTKRNINQLELFAKSVEPVVKLSVFDSIKRAIETLKTIYSKFEESSMGIVSNNQDIYYDGITNIEDYITPKSYKFIINANDIDEENTETDETTFGSIGLKDEPDVKLISLKKSGLKIKPIDRYPNISIKHRYHFDPDDYE